MKCFVYRSSVCDVGTVIGAVIMEGFYIVFDRQNKRLGFAQTACNRLTGSDGYASKVEGYYYSSGLLHLFSVFCCILYFAVMAQ